MSNSTMSQLQKEIDDLRMPVMQLSHIVLSRVFEKSELPNLQKSDAPTPVPPVMSSAETVLQLRELAVRYAHLSRLCADQRAAEEFDGLSAELADAAQRIEALFSIRGADRHDA